MHVLDLNQLEPDSLTETDLCIIGAGPAGLSIANEFVGTSTRVLILESGGLADEPDTQALYEIESTGAPRIINQDMLRTRVLGGSSHVWAGRCTPFDASDFERRSWIPFSGWPLTLTELEPYLARAAPYLGVAPVPYDETLWRRFRVDPPQPSLDYASLSPKFWQFSKGRGGRGPMHFGRDWVGAEAQNIKILLHANVTHINISSDGARFSSVDVSSLNGKRTRIQSRAAILCCGGLENARLLLASNRVFPEGVGNRNDLVGRFLMDHVSSTVGYFDPDAAFDLRARFGTYWLDDSGGRHVYLHGLGLSPEAQERCQLLNCHAYVDVSDPADNDSWAALKRLTSSVRSGRISGPDARQVLRHFGEIGRSLHRRRFKHRPHLGAVKRVEIHLILEQLPDPESRVTLSKDKRDALGMPLSSLHWKISDTERLTARRMVQLLVQEFKRLGLPIPQGIPALEEQTEWIANCTERAHPTGTTRMSSNPKEGVVDANCEVHGVRGLFVSGSSVFPTAGAANPTLMIVAIALRLADHLKVHLSADEAAAGAPSPVRHGIVEDVAV
jgi:choline dehydrogenase-like flavoprotein